MVRADELTEHMSDYKKFTELSLRMHYIHTVCTQVNLPVINVQIKME